MAEILTVFVIYNGLAVVIVGEIDESGLRTHGDREGEKSKGTD